MTPRERFAADYGIDIDRVGVMARMADDCAKINERFCNGDPHPRNPDKADKNRNAELWDHDLDVLTADLLRYVATYGFAEVAYTGLRPCLKRDGKFVDIPA